jgi:hypothetical protein
MSEEAGGFTPADIQVLRWLALALGIITAVECVMASSTEMLVVAIGLNVLTLVTCPVAIHLRRRWLARQR